MTAVGRRLLPYGRQGWLVELDSEDVVGFAAAAQGGPGIDEVVPAARTVLVRLHPGTEPEAVAEWLSKIGAERVVTPEIDPVEIPVSYDGTDLADVAAAIALDIEDVVKLHLEGDYRCAFCGFAPGFGYLDGLNHRLHLPRRATPRTTVPAGAVAIGAHYTAVYPSASPGGWHVIGQTDAVLWDPQRPAPALLRPGTPVRFTRR